MLLRAWYSGALHVNSTKVTPSIWSEEPIVYFLVVPRTRWEEDKVPLLKVMYSTEAVDSGQQPIQVLGKIEGNGRGK